MNRDLPLEEHILILTQGFWIKSNCFFGLYLQVSFVYKLPWFLYRIYHLLSLQLLKR